jgi:CheY-like chemotaxis protein
MDEVESQKDQEIPARILVVDDDDAIRTMVERILRRERFEVDSARDGFEAIEKLARSDYGTVLLDLMMPRVDGHGVLQYLVTESRTSQPSVIIMTANVQSLAATPPDATMPMPLCSTASPKGAGTSCGTTASDLRAQISTSPKRQPPNGCPGRG